MIKLFNIMFFRLFTFLFTFSFAFGQSLSGEIKNLSNSDLDLIRSKLLSDQVNQIDIEKADKSETYENFNNVTIKSDDQASNEDNINYFGYNFFDSEFKIFDNIPTPSDYKLGPGDEIILSLWGETNSRENFILNKDGSIYYENLGFINLANQSIDSAEKMLFDRLSEVYSTLQTSSTNLRIELVNLKSINIYITGQAKNPGMHIIHPFSDVFSTIVQANGIETSGSLRNVQLIRDNKLIKTFDFYNFFTTGANNFSEFKLMENDIIFIPSVKDRVLLKGEANRVGYFEILPNETIKDLIDYAGGTTSNASSEIIYNKRNKSSYLNPDSLYDSFLINYDNISKNTLSNGDEVDILKIKRNLSFVTVYGRVMDPGQYPADNLKEVLESAGGFNDPIFSQSIDLDNIIVLRKNKDSVAPKEFKLTFKDTQLFELIPSDVVFVYEDNNYNNLPMYNIEGEVARPGTYPFKKGITINDAINIAGGFTEFANQKSIAVAKTNFLKEDKINNVKEKININGYDLDYQFDKDVTISINQIQNYVMVVGAVQGGDIALAYDKSNSISDYIVAAGGFERYAFKRKAFLERANGSKEILSFFDRKFKRINPGDKIVVPLKNEDQQFDTNEFLTSFSQVLAQLATIAILANSLDNN